MSMNNLIADTIARINNAQRARHDFVIVKSSKMIASILNVLKEEGYIADFQAFNEKPGINLIKVDLKYYNGRSVIERIKVISKPGCRKYTALKTLPQSCNGFGVMIISTAKGVMSDFNASKLGIGGEVICEVY